MYPFPKKAYLFTQAFLDLDQLLSTFYVVRILSDFLSSGIFGSGFAYMYANVHKAQNFHHHYERISQKFERLIFQTNIREVHSIPKHNNTSYFRLTNKLTWRPIILKKKTPPVECFVANFLTFYARSWTHQNMATLCAGLLMERAGKLIHILTVRHWLMILKNIKLTITFRITRGHHRWRDEKDVSSVIVNIVDPSDIRHLGTWHMFACAFARTRFSIFQ